MSGRDIVGVLNLIIIAGIVAAISYAAFILQPPEYDRDTLCLAGATPPHRVVVVDKTDHYSEPQAEAIARLIIDERDRLDVGERLSLFELDERGEFRSSNAFSLCNPGSGAQVNPLYRNPDRVQARYEALFAGPLQRTLADLVIPKDAPRSPILEALARLANTEGFDPDTPARRIVLVSDMLENSDLFSVYGRRRLPIDERLPEPEAVADALIARYGDVLYGVDLEIRLILREPFVEEQQGDLRAYWDVVFAELGLRPRWRGL